MRDIFTTEGNFGHGIQRNLLTWNKREKGKYLRNEGNMPPPHGRTQLMKQRWLRLEKTDVKY